MYKETSIGVIVPAYNEEGLIGSVIETIPRFVDRVYVVDDGSTDGTWEEIDRFADWRTTVPDGGALIGDGRAGSTPVESGGGGTAVVAIRHDTNCGVGAAIKTGYRRAVTDGLDVIAVMNGDGQMDPDHLHRIVDPVVEGVAHYAKGNRLYPRENTGGMSNWRRFGNAILTTLTRMSSGYWTMMDPQNGYTAISSEAIQSIDIESLYDRYGFLNELLVQLSVHGMVIADVSHPAQYGEERSTIRYSTFIPQVSWLLLRSFLWRLRMQYLVYGLHPMVLGYLLGPLFVLGGIVSGGPPGGGGNALSVLTVGVGVLTWLLAVDADVAHNRHRVIGHSHRPMATDRPVDRVEVPGGSAQFVQPGGVNPDEAGGHRPSGIDR